MKKKKQIRRFVFETNSSSSHSLTIGGEMEMDTSLVPDDEGKIIVTTDGEFGWEIETYNDAYTKLQYAIQDGCEDLCRQAIKQQLDAELEIIEPESDGWSYGYIDHQSSGTVKYEITDVYSMINFIFNKSAYLNTDNDNY